uniref:Uncharacterized protein n=1 Tax=Clytia hemisphaerica TaxID=252671 RepID=A0A7M5XMC8_9CNID
PQRHTYFMGAHCFCATGTTLFTQFGHMFCEACPIYDQGARFQCGVWHSYEYKKVKNCSISSKHEVTCIKSCKIQINSVHLHSCGCTPYQCFCDVPYFRHHFYMMCIRKCSPCFTLFERLLNGDCMALQPNL